MILSEKIETIAKRAALSPTAKRLLLPSYLSVLHWLRKRENFSGKLVGYKPFPILKDREIVRDAKRHLALTARGNERDKMPRSGRWSAFAQQLHEAIDSFETVEDVIFWGQCSSNIHFDHRLPAEEERYFYRLYEDALSSEFRHFPGVMAHMAESPYCRPETLAVFRERLVSNVFYWNARYVLQCLTHIREPKVVCEIGSGYGLTARLWLQNPIHRPDLYILVDFPESLIFAETFLRANFPDLKSAYIDSSAPLDSSVTSRLNVLFCPIQFVDAISTLNLDLVINTGSMGEMTEEAVDSWMSWLQKQECRYFYSLNYFGQPLSFMAEAANRWSPRLTKDWTVRFQAANPAFIRMHTARDFVEIIAEKGLPPVGDANLLAHYEMLRPRRLDLQMFLEALDVIRLCPQEEIVWDLLQRCVAEMATIPKEAQYLCEHLAKNATPAFGVRIAEPLREIRAKLDLIRAQGREDMLP